MRKRDDNVIAKSSDGGITGIQEKINNLEAQIKQQPAVVHDGSLIWKITHVNDKLNAARSGQQRYLDSPPFFSSPTGYKMCARLYLNGDGNQSRGKFISLFFMLMPGEFDAILHWPFNFTIKFSLITQSDEQPNIDEIFLPDSKSPNICGKPLLKPNEPIGIPQFYSLDLLLQKYIKDGTMFLKINMEFGERFQILSSKILPPLASSTCTSSSIVATDEKRQSTPDDNMESGLCII
ncbi:unnamed protein product [Didymodactylos carnosus]|uniref:MATH domain-containing protein n=1 Tax=Didymodactylos carnosus TaxID=1234261 RepID=A0A815J0E1_9BILA|nr:unnamed protein product [Didymodactylos carnosus]CAF1506197.1 unnamed protein product [Didymodactylos carnosus]CAF4260448.1 unnamed protein product [Didymodactylos carnosus]CAF4294402.1 unnamed protein product [Didymodactylos carnosus]